MNAYFDDHRGADAATNSDADGHAAASGRAGRAEAPAAIHDSGAAVTRTSAPRNGPLTARGRLEIATRQLRSASDDLERHRRPIHRLRQRIAAAESAERALETHRQTQLTRQGAWLADGGAPDARPAESDELLAAEQHLIRCQADAAAARAVIGDHEAALSEAARHVAALTAARDDAHRACVLAIVGQHIADRYLQAMVAARALEKDIWDTYDALRASGDGQTAAAVAQALRDAKGKLSSPPPAEPQRGRQFLDALLADPGSAQLGQ